MASLLQDLQLDITRLQGYRTPQLKVWHPEMIPAQFTVQSALSSPGWTADDCCTRMTSLAHKMSRPSTMDVPRILNNQSANRQLTLHSCKENLSHPNMGYESNLLLIKPPIGWSCDAMLTQPSLISFSTQGHFCTIFQKISLWQRSPTDHKWPVSWYPWIAGLISH